MRSKVKNFKVKNTGVLDEANIELGDITLIFGRNNTGKTALAYRFLDGIRDIRSYRPVKKNIDSKEHLGKLKAYLQNEDHKQIKLLLEERIKEKLNTKPHRESKTSDHNYGVRLGSLEINLDLSLDTTKELLLLYKNKKFMQALQSSVSLLLEGKNDLDINPLDHLLYMLVERVFACTNERNALAGWREELRLHNEINSLLSDRGDLIRMLKENGLDEDKALSLLPKIRASLGLESKRLDSDYESLILSRQHIFNLDFKTKSTLDKDGYALRLLAKITGAPDYELDEGSLLFKPNDFKGEKSTDGKINIKSASGSTKSLMLLDYYLRHRARPGDLLVIDEPEMNLDPYNQILLARLFVLLAKHKIQIVITTHSDFIVRELSNCIALNNLTINQIKELQDYGEEYKLNSHKVKAYTMQKVEDGRCVAKEVEVDARYGICAYIFDDAIEAQNRDQDRIFRRLPKDSGAQND